MSYITVNGKRFLIRGADSATQLRHRFLAFKRKYPDSKLTLAQWLVQRGGTYTRVR